MGDYAYYDLLDAKKKPVAAKAALALLQNLEKAHGQSDATLRAQTITLKQAQALGLCPAAYAGGHTLRRGWLHQQAYQSA